MRWSFLDGKMVINVRNGETLGTIRDADLVVDETTGEILQLIIPQGGFLNFGGPKEWMIPWSRISQVGSQVILVDVPLEPLLDGNHDNGDATELDQPG